MEPQDLVYVIVMVKNGGATRVNWYACRDYKDAQVRRKVLSAPWEGDSQVFFTIETLELV